MENNLKRHITERINLGDMVVHKELAVIPLLSRETGGPDTAKDLVGSALAVDDWYVHMAFFRAGTSQRHEPREWMSSMSRRRAYRSGPVE